MIVCPKCREESSDDAAFCGFCGQKLHAERQKQTLYGVSAISRKELLAGRVAAAEPQLAELPDDQRGAPSDTLRTASVRVGPLEDAGAAAPLPDVEDLDEPSAATDAGWDDVELSSSAVVVANEESVGHAAPVPTLSAELSPTFTPDEMVAPTLPMHTYEGPQEVRAARDTIRTEKAPERGEVASPLSAIDLDEEPEYPAPVVPDDDPKGSEEAFFGATLSRYGMAPAQKLPEMTPELRKARLRSMILFIFGVIVIGAIIGAIGFMMTLGE